MEQNTARSPELNPRRLWFVFGASLTLLFIAFVTLAPLRFKPRTGHPHVERFVAFALLGALAQAAYPRRPRLALLGVIAAAVALEWAQHFAPSRHPHIADAVAKVAGGLCGFGLSALVAKARPRLFGRSDPAREVDGVAIPSPSEHAADSTAQPSSVTLSV